MSSPAFATRIKASQWTVSVTLGGAALWAVFAALAGLGRAPFSIVELLFLLAALVIVPLGIELEQCLNASTGSSLHTALRFTQLPVSLAVCIAFWLPPGRTAAILSGLWLLQCLLLAGERVRRSRRDHYAAISLIVSLAYCDLIFGSAWLLISRVGWRPMGFQEPIILLTAVHFHYSGFATALIASTTLGEFHRTKLAMPGLPALVWSIALLPFAVAAGFVFSPLLRFVAAIALSSAVTALAMVAWWFASELRSGTARVFLRLASRAAAVAFSLAGIYAVSEFFKLDWITVPAMANSHGVLNGVGFVLLSMLAWLIELNGPGLDGNAPRDLPSDNPDAQRVSKSVGTWSSPTPLEPTARRAPIPDFIARDFYDR